MIRSFAFALTLSTSLLACSKEAPAPAQAAIPANAHSIAVDGSGYSPDRITLPAGEPATLIFTRTSDDGCGQQLAFPTLGIRKDLPLNQPVTVEFTPQAGEIRFTCGMDMYRGMIVAQ